MTTHALRHLDELHQRVGVSDGFDVTQVGHVKFLFDIRPVSFQYIFLVTHFSKSLIILWNGFFGNSIILWPSAHGFRLQFMSGEGMMLAQWASAVPRL